jgi:hypothetical protein
LLQLKRLPKPLFMQIQSPSAASRPALASRRSSSFSAQSEVGGGGCGRGGSVQEGKIDDQVQGFLDFVNASPSAFHAVQSAKERLLGQGFVQLKENEEWKLKAGQKYFFTRNHSSLFAFVVGGKYVRPFIFITHYSHLFMFSFVRRNLAMA